MFRFLLFLCTIVTTLAKPAFQRQSDTVRLQHQFIAIENELAQMTKDELIKFASMNTEVLGAVQQKLYSSGIKRQLKSINATQELSLFQTSEFQTYLQTFDLPIDTRRLAVVSGLSQLVGKMINTATEGAHDSIMNPIMKSIGVIGILFSS